MSEEKIREASAELAKAVDTEWQEAVLELNELNEKFHAMQTTFEEAVVLRLRLEAELDKKETRIEEIAAELRSAWLHRDIAIDTLKKCKILLLELKDEVGKQDYKYCDERYRKIIDLLDEIADIETMKGVDKDG